MAGSLGLRRENSIKIAYPELRRMRMPWTRAVGLIGRKKVKPGAAYLFGHCPSVHTHLMRTAIDVIVCDKHMTVLAVETMEPGRSSSPKVRGARAVVESAPGSAAEAGIAPGSSLCLVKGWKP